MESDILKKILRDAARRPLDELTEDWRILRDKPQRNHLGSDGYQGATFYLSNLGVFERVSHFYAIVPPEAATILALGAEEDGNAEFTLSCDHRVVFGTDAARFLKTPFGHLSTPESMATEVTDKFQLRSKGKIS